jgi:hypothetical protein
VNSCSSLLAKSSVTNFFIVFRFAWIIIPSGHMTDALSLYNIQYLCCKVLYFILSEDDFEIKSKMYSLDCLVSNHILNSQDGHGFFKAIYLHTKEL